MHRAACALNPPLFGAAERGKPLRRPLEPDACADARGDGSPQFVAAFARPQRAPDGPPLRDKQLQRAVDHVLAVTRLEHLQVAVERRLAQHLSGAPRKFSSAASSVKLAIAATCLEARRARLHFSLQQLAASERVSLHCLKNAVCKLAHGRAAAQADLGLFLNYWRETQLDSQLAALHGCGATADSHAAQRPAPLGEAPDTLRGALLDSLFSDPATPAAAGGAPRAAPRCAECNARKQRLAAALQTVAFFFSRVVKLEPGHSSLRSTAAALVALAANSSAALRTVLSHVAVAQLFALPESTLSRRLRALRAAATAALSALDLPAPADDCSLFLLMSRARSAVDAQLAE